MTFAQLFYYFIQLVATVFVLGFAYETLLQEQEDDDDDDGGGGILQPVYVTER